MSKKKQSREAAPAKTPWYLHGALWVGVAFVLQLYHAWGYVQVPQFWGEEGRDFFKAAYDRGLASLWDTCGGYLHVLPRLAAVIATLLPLDYAPQILMAAAWAGQAALYWLVWSPRLQLAPRARILFTLAVALVPNGGEVLLNLTNVQWYTGPALLFVLLREPPPSPRALTYDIAWLVALGLLGPYLVLFLPLIGLARWAEGSWRAAPPQSQRLEAIRWAAAAAVALLHFAFWHLQERQSHVAASTATALDAWAGAFANLVLPFFLGAVPPWMRGGVDWAWVVVALGLFALAVWLLFPQRSQWRRALRLAPLLCGGIAYAAGIWEGRDHPQGLHPYGDGQRSFFILYLAVAWLLALTASDASLPRWQQRAAAACLAVSALFSIYRFDILMRRADFHYPAQVQEYNLRGRYLFRQPPNWTFELDRDRAWYR